MADRFASLDEVKAWLGISDTDRDDLLASLADAVTEALIGEMKGRDPRRRRYTETVHGRGGPGLPVNHFPICSVIEVKLDGAVIPPDQITFDDNLIYRKCGIFPTGIRNVAATYVAGLAQLPADILLAARYTAKAFWDARKIDMNSQGESWVGVGGASFWPTGPGSVPPQALSLLARYANVMKV